MDDSDTDYMTYGRRTQRFVLEGKHIRKHKDGIENFNDYFSDTDEDSSSDESRHLNDEGRQKQNRQLTTRNTSAQHIEDSTDSSADIDEYTALNVENNLNFAVSPKQRRKFTTQELEDRATVLKENKSANIKIIRKKCRVLDSESGGTSKSLKSKSQPECFHRSSETTAVFSAETPSDNNDGHVAIPAKRRKDENNEISALPTAHKNDQSPFKKTSLKKKPSKTTSKSLKSKNKPERLHRNSEITAVFTTETSDDDDALVASPAKKRKDENNEISARPTIHQNAQSPLKKRSSKKKPLKTTSKSLKSKSQAELPHRNSETTAVFSAGTCDDDEAYVASPAKKRKNETPNEAIIKDSRVVLKDIFEKSPQKGRNPANKSSVKSFTPHNKVGKEKGRTKKQVKNQETTNANELRRSKRTRRSPLKSWCNERVRYRYNLNGEITFVDIVKYEPEKKTERRKRKNKTKISKLPKQPKSLTVFDGSTGLVSAQVFQPEGSTEWLCTDEHTLETAPYLITRIFQSENISFGFLKLKRLQKKPSQQLPHSDACFMVFKGQVKVKIHKSVFCAQPCDSFIVPCGNAYSVENISNTSALLSFCIYTGSILSDLVV